ncbi:MULTISPECIES: creatininase family protein [unclassified Serratia (in: enterobacteria)]|uniref:creatininase family protein n=1 Tax=unclassified Serratia (in: enterobacteria) TaxID=2647522 RepID=UPI0005089FE7|nr:MULTISPECIES: creatininase family protein [unclassified Serratia (in: enterobacteria)]KFK96880.1 creatininase [Serratia sp. Ag2]KFK97423.1 creatininase [Serratia sp. Ag1]
MKIIDMNWMQLESYLQQDDRVVVPLGSVEQHAYLSLAVDMILAEKVAVDAAEPLGIPVYPAIPFGVTPYFAAFPGTVSLRVETYVRVIHDLLDSLARSGFKRIVLVNGHGGNQPAASAATEWMLSNPDVKVRFYNWWNAPNTLANVRSVDPTSSHASWMENLPWTRLADAPCPDARKAPIDYQRFHVMNAAQAKEYLGDGNFGGWYQRPAEVENAMWQVAVEETRAILQGPWE